MFSFEKMGLLSPLLLKIIGFLFRKKPIIFHISAFNDQKILVNKICEEPIIVRSIHPSEKLSPFPIDFLVKSESPFYIYSNSSFTTTRIKKITLKIKMLDGSKRTYYIKWKNKTPYIK